MHFTKAFFIAASAVAALSAAPALAAPALTSVQIIEIYSTQYGTVESINPSQYLTVQDHGGAQVRITVREIGYAQTVRTVTLDGVIVSNSAVQTWPLCGTALAPTRTCPNGSIYIGFDRQYQIDGSSGGKYSVTARNASSPFNAITDWIQIQ